MFWTVGKRLKTLELKSDETGSVEGKFELEREAKLGEYRILLECPGDLHITNQRQWWDITEQSSIFRVEEYKRPEYQVKVIPSNSPLPDNQVGFDIEASYFFGELSRMRKSSTRFTSNRTSHLRNGAAIRLVGMELVMGVTTISILG